MANLVPAPAGGNWSAAASWIDTATGLAPAAAPALGTDSCFLGRSTTLPTITNINAATSGGTTVTLTFTGTLPAGMVFKIAGTAGIYTTLLSVGSGVSVPITPPLEANVTAGSAVTAYSCGNITIDTTTCACGVDKTQTSLTVGGGDLVIGAGATLSHAVNANTKLRVRGGIMLCPGGKYLCGTVASPIQASYTAEVEINAAASPTFGAKCFKVGGTSARVTNGDGTQISFVHATTRTRNAKLTSGISAGATSCDLHSVTGWTSTDYVGFMPTRTTGSGSSVHTDFEYKTLTGLSGSTASWSGGLAGPHLINGHVGNFTAGITLNGVSASQGFCIYIDILAACNDLTLEMENAAVNFGGAWNPDTSFGASAICLAYNGGPTTARNLRVNSCAFANMQRNSVLISGGRVKANTIDGCAFAQIGSRGCLYFGNSCGGTTVSDCSLYLASRWNAPTFGFGSCGNTFNRCVVCTGPNNSIIADHTDGTGDTYNDCVFLTCQFAVNANNLAQATFNRCYFGVDHPTYGGGGGGFTTSALNANQVGALGNYAFNACVFNADPGITNQTTRMNNNPDVNRFSFVNYNADATQQRESIYTGNIYRDNAQLIRSRSSIRFEPKITNTALVKSFLVAATAGLPTILRFGLRYDTTYGTGTPPSVTVSGLGITPQTFNAGGSANTDDEGTITVTPVTTGNLTVTVSGQSTATTGNFWFSGMSYSPWIDWSWHYGYQYTPGLPALTVDANIVANEATAIGYTGAAWSSPTLTLTSVISPQNLYDWAQAYGAANRLAQFVSGSPSSLLLAGNLTVSGTTFTGTITASGTLTASMTAGGAYTYTGGSLSVSSAVPTFAAGTLNIGAAATYGFSSTGTLIVAITPSAPSTYTFTGAQAGTLDLRNQTAHAITVQLPGGTTYTTASNTGGTITVTLPPVTHTMEMSAFANGTRVRVYNVTAATEIANELVTGGAGYARTLTLGVDYTSGDLIRWAAYYVTGTTYYRPMAGSFTATSGAYAMSDAMTVWQEPTDCGVDWTAVTECTTDYASVQVDVDDPDNNGYKSRYAAFITGAMLEEDGIRNWITLTGTPVIAWLSSAAVRIDTTVATVEINNNKAASILRVTDSFALNWSDGVDHINAILGSSIVWKNAMEVAVVETGTSGLTGAESAKLLSLDTQAVNVESINGATVIGTGTTGDAWRGVGVSP